MSTGKGLRLKSGPDAGGKKSPPLDEFEKMERELEELEKTHRMNGVEKKRSDGEKKKKKKKKKSDKAEEKENKKVALQSREDILEKHVGPRVRSFDTAKMKSKFNKPKETTQVPAECRICDKPVFQMEKIVAEKFAYHKNCFRCSVCNKTLTLETYQSHEGKLYCKPHLQDLFKPKAVVQDEEEERRDRLRRRPRMIVLESNPEALPDDVVRATEKPDYGLEDLQTMNVKQRFSMFENASKSEDAPKLERISVQRSQSLMTKAARFLEDQEGQNGDLDEYDEEEEESEEESEDENGVVKSRKKKERPMSFSGIGDLKNAFEQKQRREEMSQARKEEIGRFRQLLCAGKNSSLKEMFESGKFDEEDEEQMQKEKVKIEVKHAAKSLREKFEKGRPFILEDDEEGAENRVQENGESEEKHQVNEIFKEAETAKKARNVFKQIDSTIKKEGTGVVMRSQSFAQAPRENRRSQDVSFLALQTSPSTAEVIKSNDRMDDFQVDTTDLVSRFKFFANYEERQKAEEKKKKKVFRITPPRENVDQGLNTSEQVEIGRDPNLIKSSDKYEDDVDCRNTKNILQMFLKMEKGKEEEEEQEEPRPLKRFTPPPEGEKYNSNSESDEEEYSSDYTGSEEETDSEEEDRPKYKDEILEMLSANSQSARKAAQLRAKFERYENDVEQRSSQEIEEEEFRPSLDTARNLKAMFESKAVEETKPVLKAAPSKVNRFV